MAKSKFLPYQDKDGDGVNDACPDLDITPEPFVCLDCSPNPNALVPNWTKRKRTEPFLNEKNCKYQITITTKETTTGATPGAKAADAAAALSEIWEENASKAAENLLIAFDKDHSDASISALLDAPIEYTEYELDPRANSHLKLLYSVPFEALNSIDDATTDEEDEEEDAAGDILIEYEAAKLIPNMIKIRQAFDMYARYYRVYRSIERGNIKFINSGGILNIEDYGDSGFWADSTMASLIQQLDAWLNRKQFNLAGTGDPLVFFNMNEQVTRIRFRFSKDYELKRLLVWSQYCPEKASIYGKKDLEYFTTASAWRDPVAVAYFAQIDDMMVDLEARTPMHWIDFLTKYTLPEVRSTISEADENPGQTITSCVMEALENEGKELGQDIMDDVFTLADSVAYMYHNNLCSYSLQEEMDRKKQFGQAPNVGGDGLDNTSIAAMAQHQAFKNLQMQDQVMAEACAKLLATVGGFAGFKSDHLEDMWEGFFNKIQVCGLYELLVDAIQCLFKGVSLENALSSMVGSALRSMGVENFGDLFIGLPPEKQQELDALVKQKLERGEFFKEGSGGQKLSDAMDSGKDTFPGQAWEKPWTNSQTVKDNKKTEREGPFGPTYASGKDPSATEDRGSTTTPSRDRTLAQKFDLGASTQGKLDPSVVMDAYIIGLIEVYSDNLFELLDHLNRFPGARIVMFVLATFDCPRPPLGFDFLDFLHDNLELPFCNFQMPISGPFWFNPLEFFNDITDVLLRLWELFKFAMEQLYYIVMMNLMQKICELIGDAICAALGIVGDLAASLPALATGRTQVYDVVKESICGPDASQQEVEDTIEDLFNSLGSNGQALGNKQKVLTFAEDLSASVTGTELKQLFLGEPSDTALRIVDSLLDYEYQEMRRALPNSNAVGRFFKNVGNLFPQEFKEQLRDSIDNLADQKIPANPTLCASNKDLQDFENLRCSLLSGRATQEQCDVMYDQFRGRLEDALKDVGDIMQKGPGSYIEDNMPPLISDPGCSNGLLPFETDQAISDAASGLDSDMEQLKISFSEDMLGNGGLFGGSSDWGLMNMILSDTKGNPLTAHLRGVYNSDSYVNFYNNYAPTDANDSWARPRVSPIYNQEGAYPTKVADWMQLSLAGSASDVTFLNPDYSFNNNSRPEKTYTVGFEKLGIEDGFFTDLGTQLLGIPDRGYNVQTKVDMQNSKIKFARAARKDKPDIQLQFRDNARGMRTKGQSEFSYGFNLNLYLSDIVEKIGDDGSPAGVYINRPDDNARVYITNIFNDSARVPQAMAAYEKLDDDGNKVDPGNNSDKSINKDRYMEFLSIDDGLEGVDLQNYPKLAESLATQKDYVPQIAAFSDLTKLKPDAALQSFYDTIMKTTLQKMASEVAANENAFSYGAQFDTLVPTDLEYVVDQGQTLSDGGILYGDAKILDTDGEERSISNDDMILGISRMEYNEKYNDGVPNRVHYLDPTTFGGTHNNPGVYVKPLKNVGWLGFIDVLFPELSPCKPTRSDLVDFGEIQNRVSNTYPTIAMDERLQEDPECVVELPYNRILHRGAIAGIDGLISAACRIYASTHFIKAMATFSTFSPDFDNVYSNIFAQYIVENMEKRFKEANSNGPGWEWLTAFKDDEFWYSFLEQSVQNYARRVDSGEIPNPPSSVLRILTSLSEINPEIAVSLGIQEDLESLNDLQTSFKSDYPFREDLNRAKENDEVSWWEGLENYRMEQNLFAIKKTEEKAKLILKEVVKEELRYMGKKFLQNLEGIDMAPKYFDLDWYLLQHMTQGQSLDLDKEIKEEVKDLPTSGDSYYTSGDEFANSETNAEYVGYYHVHVDEGGDTIYMEGEQHSSMSHVTLQPIAKRVSVPIGDIDEYSYAEYSWDPESPFVIEKYISIDGEKKAPTVALSEIKSKPGADNISDHYPGTMKLTVDPENSKIVGIEGELGVRYGLRFSFYDGASKKVITTVEIDALDTTIANIAPLDADTKLLYCLIKLLKEDEKFRLLSRYVFPLNKLISMVAIYNDMGFLPSIGEVTVSTNQSTGIDTSVGTKPGMAAEVTKNDDGTLSISYDGSVDGWQSNNDRTPGALEGWFVEEYDSWDKILLRNTTSRIKKLFKGYYTSRKFEPPEDLDGAGKIWLKGLKGSFNLMNVKGYLPWWRRDRLRTNPFDANDELCKKKD